MSYFFMIVGTSLVFNRYLDMLCERILNAGGNYLIIKERCHWTHFPFKNKF